MADLFADFPPPEDGPYGAAVTPNRTVPAAARARVSRQCHGILARLRHGRASNRELSRIALKYTGRKSELVRAGYDIRIVHEDHKSGLTVYALFEDGREVGNGKTSQASDLVKNVKQIIGDA